ncbi:hypothetical protein H310_09491 [Aphanomyces invadans]|uniref:Uncharacterized protein n=1 Tax=Aphanomyces invadans TaxID=157072 RepID=A0A024TTU4_9STRA|nr:hypothetical protein H310_09491 [Aphanomyces invadans]ETV97595.1 hypothetical protein H310_09491 [Aphanomyces invadans]|eukprot:XP_008873804.1 hypothetical protein H310_09491 [Aphanomyces invadans]
MPRTTKHDLSDDERLSLYHELLENKQNCRLARGKAKPILLLFGISRQKLSKRHIVKVMLLTPAERPRFEYAQKTMWDGKVGMWPFVVDDLVAAVHGAYNELDWSILEKTIMTLQRVMEESLKMGGDNSYKLPHQSKDKMARV